MSKPTALADVIQDVHQTTPRVRHPGVVAISRERHRGAGEGATACDEAHSGALESIVRRALESSWMDKPERAS